MKAYQKHSPNLPKMAILAATPLTIHFFFKGHLRLLVEKFSISLIFNKNNDAYLPNLNLPIEEISIDIARQISIFQDIRALFQLICLCKRGSFDLFVTVAPKAGLLGMIAAYITGVPRRVHIFQGEVWASKTGIYRKILKISDLITANLATEILAVSYSEKVFLEKEGIAPLGKIQVLGDGSICGVDLNRYYPNPIRGQVIRRQLNIPPEAFVVLFIGRMVRDKGLLDLSKAFRKVAESNPDCYLVLVGPSEDPVALEALKILDEVKNQYRMIGYSEEAELYLSGADVLCLPSYREGFPIVILEAAAMRVPAIGSRIYGVSDAIIDRVTGILFDVGDVIELTHALEEVRDNEALRCSLGEAAYARVRSQFESGLVVGRYLNFFLNLLGESKKADQY